MAEWTVETRPALDNWSWYGDTMKLYKEHIDHINIGEYFKTHSGFTWRR